MTRPASLRLHGWRHPAILAAGVVSVAAGFAQFSATAALGDVAQAFGAAPGDGPSIAAQAGLSATTVGLGLALIRGASLAALPLAAQADRWGRRRMLLACVAGGLALTSLAALTPGYWWFVAAFAFGRPLLSATNALAGVIAAEETRSADRAKAVALIAAGYGTGAGLTALIRGVAGAQLGFRGLFALALVPLAALPLIGRLIEEPERYRQVATAARRPVLGRVGPELRPRLALLGGLTMAVGLVTGPANTFLFFYAEGVLEVTPATMAAVVLVAGPVGLTGLLLGRWAADALGRRGTAVLTHTGVAVAGIVTYAGGRPGVMAGYLLGILSASAYGPAAGTMAAELFPTRMRSTAAGWLTAAGVVGAVAGLIAFGMLGDALGSLGLGAVVLFAPVALVSLAYLRLPETRGLELEESAPDLPLSLP